MESITGSNKLSGPGLAALGLYAQFFVYLIIISLNLLFR